MKNNLTMKNDLTVKNDLTMKNPKVRKTKNKTKYCLLVASLLVSQVVLSQDENLEGRIAKWGTTISTALNAAVGVFAVVGGFLIFIQYMQGNQEAQKNLIKFIIGLAIFGLSALIVDIFVPTATEDNG
ncbi:MAG: hypothetical protein QMC35_08225 [Polaribacter sp.]|jgi:surface polysaccharide O-acyltransferase-like enzyme